jgi:hypothetical protein
MRSSFLFPLIEPASQLKPASQKIEFADRHSGLMMVPMVARS